ncbi:MAG: hypothetical protein SGILL_010124, partial [Bacillariaceae sp.]
PSSSPSPIKFGLLSRKSKRLSIPNKVNVNVNPIVLGIQNALSRSSLPISASERWQNKNCASSQAQQQQQQQQQQDDDESDTTFYQATRSASVGPAEASDLATVTQPHLKQRRVSLFGRQERRRRRQQSRAEKVQEEAFWLDSLEAFDEELTEENEKLIPCSITQPAALQAKFQPQTQRRPTTTASKAAAAATLDASSTRGGTSAMAAAAVVASQRPLLFWESMVSGAVSRSVAQTLMHPANTMKTVLQSSRDVSLRELCKPKMFHRLTVGAGANFVLSIPHGAVNFAVLEFVRGRMNAAMEAIPALDKRKDALGPALDFLSSAVSTITCSIVSTPQMMITDNIMAGTYPNLVTAANGLYQNRGIQGFYAGWFPGLVGKIPSYALTWTFFQQLKRMRSMLSDEPAKNYENTIMGCVASTATVCIMIPMDTIKTRLVVQSSQKILSDTAYKGIVDCAVRIAREEGIRTFYRGLAPRLISVVPMIGIQFGVYEAMKRIMLQRDTNRNGELRSKQLPALSDRYGPEQAIEEAAMETAADGSNNFPAPHFHSRQPSQKKGLKTFFGAGK